MIDTPSRCVDSIMKCCDSCPWGCTTYPEWVESYDDLQWCSVESFCCLGYDRGRPEDEPTEEEYKKFDEWLKNVYGQEGIEK